MTQQAQLKEEFKEDYEILASKFHKQEADLAFIMGDYEKAMATATKGLELVKQVNTTDTATRKASNNTQRDLLNLIVRIRSSLEKKLAKDLRDEIGQQHELGTTFLAEHEEKTLKESV